MRSSTTQTPRRLTSDLVTITSQCAAAKRSACGLAEATSDNATRRLRMAWDIPAPTTREKARAAEGTFPRDRLPARLWRRAARPRVQRPLRVGSKGRGAGVAVRRRAAGAGGTHRAVVAAAADGRARTDRTGAHRR